MQVPTTVQGINVNGTTPGTLTITQDTTFGSTVTNAGGTQVSLVTDGVIGTLSGTSTNAADHGFNADANTNTYTGLGSIVVKGVNGTLKIESADSGQITILGTIDGSLDGTGNPQGTVEVNTPTIFKAAIGGTTPVDVVAFNNGTTVSQAGNISVKTVVRIAQDAGNNASVVFAGAINGPVIFQNPGQLTVSEGITEAVTTAGDGADGGTLSVEGGNVGNIGENGGALTKVNFNNGSANNGITAGDIYATNIIIGQNTTTGVASIVSANSINGAVDFTSPGTLAVTELMTGDATFTTNGKLVLAAGIDGDITAVGNNGNLVITGGNIATIIGDVDNALQTVTFNNGSTASETDDIYATTVIIGKNGANPSIADTGEINGAVNFTSPGQLTVTGGITEAVTTTGNGDTGGTLIVNLGNIGNVGADGAALTAVTFNNGDVLSNAGNIYATTVTIGQNATTGEVSQVKTGTINGAVNFVSINSTGINYRRYKFCRRCNFTSCRNQRKSDCGGW